MKIHQHNGFTIIEVLFVLTIISGFLSIFFTISSSVYSNIIINSFIEKLNDDLIYMRQYSITNCETTKINIYEDQHTYFITHSGLGVELLKYEYNKNIEINDSGVYGQITINSDGNFKRSGYFKIRLFNKDFVVRINEQSCKAYIE